MQNPSKEAKKFLNLRSRFASALADTPSKNGFCTLVLGENFNKINGIMIEFLNQFNKCPGTV